MAEFAVGQRLPEQRFGVTRADLIRYAGASGDFNPIHWSDRVAHEVGLPGVIAHGMFTMALAGRAVTTWAGSADAVLDFSVRFARPVVVPDDEDGTEIVVSAVVKSVSAPASGAASGAVSSEDGQAGGVLRSGVGQANTAQLDLTVTCGGEQVLKGAKATIKV